MPLTPLSPLRLMHGIPPRLAQRILLGQSIDISDESSLVSSRKEEHAKESAGSRRSLDISELARALQTTNGIRGGESEENRRDNIINGKRKRKKKRKIRNEEEKDEFLLQSEGAKDEKDVLEQSPHDNDALTLDVGRAEMETTKVKRRKRKKKGNDRALMIDAEERTDGARGEQIFMHATEGTTFPPSEGPQNEKDATTASDAASSPKISSGPGERRRKKCESLKKFVGGERKRNFDDSGDQSQQIQLNSEDDLIDKAQIIEASETSSTATVTTGAEDITPREFIKMNNSPDRGVSDNTGEASRSIVGKERKKKRKRRKANNQNDGGEVEDESNAVVIDENLAQSANEKDESTFGDVEVKVTNEDQNAIMQIDEEGDGSDVDLKRFDELSQESAVQEEMNELVSSKKRKVRKRKKNQISPDYENEEIGAPSLTQHESSVDTLMETEINGISEQDAVKDVDGDLVEATTKDVANNDAETAIEPIERSAIDSNEEAFQGDVMESLGSSVPIDSEDDRTNDTHESIVSNKAITAEVTNNCSDDELATFSADAFPLVCAQEGQEVEGEESKDDLKVAEERENKEKERGGKAFSFDAPSEAEMLVANKDESVEDTSGFKEVDFKSEKSADPAESIGSEQGSEIDGEEQSTATIVESHSAQIEKSNIDGTSPLVAEESIFEAVGEEIGAASDSDVPHERNSNETIDYSEKETSEGAVNLYGQDEMDRGLDGLENLTNGAVIQDEIAESTAAIEADENRHGIDEDDDDSAEKTGSDSEASKETMEPTPDDEEGQTFRSNHNIDKAFTLKESSSEKILFGAEESTVTGNEESHKEDEDKISDIVASSLFPHGEEGDNNEMNPPSSLPSSNDDMLPADDEEGLSLASCEEPIDDGDEKNIKDELSTIEGRNPESGDASDNNIVDSKSAENIITEKGYLHEIAEEQESTSTIGLEEPVEEFDDDCLTCSVVTWNLAESPPSEKEASFFRKFRKIDGTGSDLVMIGAQECEEIKPRRAEGHRSRHIRRLGVQMLGKDYVPLAIHSLGGIQMALYCHRDVLGDVEMIDIADVTCGVGNVFHNKGAIGAYLKMRYHAESGVTKCSRMLFITAHLAAHVKNVDARNDDFKRIVSELEAQAPMRFLRPRKNRDGTPATCDGSHLLNSVDHVFFSGDLNYRVNLPREYVEHCINEIKTCTSKEPSAAGNLMKKLLRQDQLLQTIASGKAFHGFDEGKITFLPTFKFDKGTAFYDTSHKQRVPAWTDRILFKSNKLQVLDYNSVSGAVHSDHRPVYGTFKVGWGLTEQTMKKERSTKRKKSRSSRTR